MRFALQELGKGVAGHDAPTESQQTLYHALAANDPHGPSLLDWKRVDLDLSRQATQGIAPVLMDLANPDV